jgi:hypothetical protein
MKDLYGARCAEQRRNPAAFAPKVCSLMDERVRGLPLAQSL